MVEYNPLSNISYQDYLQGKSFLRGMIDGQSKIISKEIRTYIANDNELLKKGIEIHKMLHDSEMQYLRGLNETSVRIAQKNNELINQTNNLLSKGFEVINYNLTKLSKEVTKLSYQFQWGMEQIISQLGHVNDTLSDLKKIAESPAHTAALEHLESAKKHYEHKEFEKSLKELYFALNGVPGVSSSYETEWRIYKLLATIRLGFMGCDVSLVNLQEAEESYRLAAEYVKDDPSIVDDAEEEIAKLLTFAGWAAYCQGEYEKCIYYTEKAIREFYDMSEAYYQLAKCKITTGNVNEGLEELSVAMDLDISYSLRAASDPIFQAYESELKSYFIDYGKKRYNSILNQIQEFINTNIADYQLDDIDDQLDQVIGSKTLMNLPDAEKKAKKTINNIKSFAINRRNILKKLEIAKQKVDKLSNLIINIQTTQIDLPDLNDNLISTIEEIKDMMKHKSLDNMKECILKADNFEADFDKYVSKIQSEVKNHYSSLINEKKAINKTRS